jgi:competence protein ComEA
VDTPAPTDRSARLTPLAVVVLGLTLLGALLHVHRGGTAPSRCDQPAIVDSTLVCDGRGRPPGARAWLVGDKLDVNAARRHELELVPGIGPSLARAIMDTRRARGPYASTAALDDVPGVGPKTLAKLERYVVVLPSIAVEHLGSTPERNQSPPVPWERGDDVPP